MVIEPRTDQHGNPILPLVGPSHLHLYPGGWHMADNLTGGAKTYYDVSRDGEVRDIRLKLGSKPGFALR